MQKLFPLFLFILLASPKTGFSQYWQQAVNYTIDVSLDDRQKVLDGFEKIQYRNNAPDTLAFLWFHIWPNAYKNDRTAFSDQSLENGNTKFYFSSPEERGYINRLDFKVDGITAKTEDHPQYIDVIRVLLPKPLAPGQTITITTPFHVKLPFNFSRSGFDGQSFQITQWYPKPAVYDKNGWHPLPYLDQGEFYSEFGNYDVHITLPRSYVVAATGVLQDQEERNWLKTRAAPAAPLMKKAVPAPGKRSGQHPLTKAATPPAEERKTLHFLQDSVHDFAWFADRNFIVNQDSCRLPSGRVVEVATYYTPTEAPTWKNSLLFAKDAIRFYSREVGEYPYATCTAVQGPQSFGGGMEYPTITIISPTESEKELDITMAHEIGHNWFYGILASNERVHPWMDEGINSFYENKYTLLKYGRPSQEEEIFFQTMALRKKDQPIETPAAQFSPENYELVAYHKTAEWMRYLEERLGPEHFRQTMQQYYLQWRFKHPQPEDFKAVVTQQAGTDVSDVFALLNQKGILPGRAYTGFSVVSPFKKHSFSQYVKNPTKQALLLSPAIGVNAYDKLMVGGLLTNYKLPPNPFQFLLVPLYATGSHQFTGLGKLNYTLSSAGPIRKTDVFINASRFSMDEFNDTLGNHLKMQFSKIVPGVKFTFRQKDPRSTTTQYLQWKTYFIREESFRSSYDSLFNGPDTTIFTHYATPAASRYLNQVQWVLENDRALYPFDFTVQLEQAKDFLRPVITGDYFFNYPKAGGLQLRFFAGKFIYLNGKTITKQFDNDRYFLNMTGPKGYEDYTYSDYFLGRNKFEGLENQQIMIRDGGFKVRTDLLSDKIGKTDDWLMAVNLASTLPDKINPLSVLPVKIPLRVFLDVGTYAAPWKKNADADRFLFDAGFYIPLFRESLNIYIPLFYNKVYGDYFKSTLTGSRFLKTISFSINLYNRDLRQLNREIEF
ncbi:MAG: M1 family metallopeptidase [Flavisolibacter sp.]